MGLKSVSNELVQERSIACDTNLFAFEGSVGQFSALTGCIKNAKRGGMLSDCGNLKTQFPVWRFEFRSDLKSAIEFRILH